MVILIEWVIVEANMLKCLLLEAEWRGYRLTQTCCAHEWADRIFVKGLACDVVSVVLNMQPEVA